MLEKHHILFHPENSSLNQRSEFFTVCRHKEKHLLMKTWAAFLFFNFILFKAFPFICSRLSKFTHTGCPQKKDLWLWRAIEPLRIEVGIKVRGVSESAGAEHSGTYHNFSVAHLGPEIFEFKVSPVPKINFLMWYPEFSQILSFTLKGHSCL